MTTKPDPLLKDVLPAPPVATRVFDPQQTITFLAELYDNSSRSSHAVDFAATVRAASDGRVVFNMRDERTIQAGNTSRTEGYKGEILAEGFRAGQRTCCAWKPLPEPATSSRSARCRSR